MNYKVLALILLSLSSLYTMILNIIAYRSKDNEIPENCKDIYDEQTYRKWKDYVSELGYLVIFKDLVSYAVTFCLIMLNCHAKVADKLGATGIYSQLLVVIAFEIIIETLFGIIFSYIGDMVIEQKYGFNKMTIKTFISDQIKGFIVESAITIGLLCLFAMIHIKLGNWMLVVFTVVAVAFLLLFTFLYPKLNRLYNKFRPLEDGELKTKLNALLTKHGYQVKAIEVMDASKRSTKSNAYFTGYGKLKTIVLYDTLVESMTPDEICAVFAHELGHGLHKDTLKNSFRSGFLIASMVVMAWILVSFESIYPLFGFGQLNYGFAYILLSSVVLPVLAPIIELFNNYFSRKAEYKADAFAASEGYGENLTSALKKLAKENFSNLSPSPVIVKLKYSHPSMSQRLEAIEKADKR